MMIFSISPRHGSDDGGATIMAATTITMIYNRGGWVALTCMPACTTSWISGMESIHHWHKATCRRAQSSKGSGLHSGSRNSVVYNGTTYALQVKDNDNQVEIKFEDGQVFTGNGQVNIWLDFDAGRSIRMRDHIFELRSSIRAFSKENLAG